MRILFISFALALFVIVGAWMILARSAKPVPSDSDNASANPATRPAAVLTSPDGSDKTIYSLVFLLATPRAADQATVSRAVEKAFVTTIDGDAYFVKPTPRPGLIQVHTPDMNIGIISVNAPYFDNVAAEADSLRLFRAKTAVQQHKAWLSFDLIGPPPSGGDKKTYAILGKLAAEFLSDDVLAILCTSTGEIAPLDERTAAQLRSGNPLQLFSLSPNDGITPVAKDDPEMAAAEAEARRRWPEFVAAFTDRKPEQGFAVKKRFTNGEANEHMWVEVSTIDAGSISGKLANEPDTLRNLKLGDPVTLLPADVEDWIYSAGNHMEGGFTAKVLEKRNAP